MLRILLPLLFLILLTACSPVHAEPAFPSCVDTNGDGVIDRDEVILVIAAYFAGQSEPTFTPTPTSNPTPAPTVTDLIPGDGTLTVHWTSPVQASVYWVQVSKKGWREPITYNEPSSPKTYRDLTTGTYSVRVSIAGKNPLWSEPRTATITVATPPTPTPIAPRTRECRWSDQYSREAPNFVFAVTVNNPHSPTQDWHARSVSWIVEITFWNQANPSDKARVVLAFNESGQWTLNLNNHEDIPFYTIEHGQLSNAGVDFDSGWGASNEFKLDANGGYEKGEYYSIRFWVNDVEVPIELDQEDRDQIRYNLYFFWRGFDSDDRFLRGTRGVETRGTAVFHSEASSLYWRCEE